MIAQRLQDAINAAPFRPFRLYFGSGRNADVMHPEFVHLSPSGRTAVVYLPARGEDGEHPMQIIDVLLVESIEFLPTKGAANNGTGGEKR